MVPSGFNLATQLALVKVGGGDPREARPKHTQACAAQIHTEFPGSVPLMVPLQDFHEIRTNKTPLLQDGKAACKIDFIARQCCAQVLLPSHSFLADLSLAPWQAPSGSLLVPTALESLASHRPHPKDQQLLPLPNPYLHLLWLTSLIS